jgi:hypothetical protein
LFGCARTQEIENVVVGQIYDLRDALSHLGGRLRLPFAQPGVQLLNQGVHDGLLALIVYLRRRFRLGEERRMV